MAPTTPGSITEMGGKGRSKMDRGPQSLTFISKYNT